MKKWVATVLSAVMVMSMLAGCGGKGETADVVVVGAGGAGLSAAVKATEDGAKVIVLEKMPMVGGNTTRATGGLNAAGTKQQIAKGIKDSQQLFFEDTMKGGYDKNNPDLVQVLTTNAKGSVEWLEGFGADLSDVGRMAGASVNRTHRPTGGAAVGSHIASVLDKTAKDKGIDVRTRNELTEIVTDKDGNVTGVKAKDKEGKEYTINAKAVVLATGGFSANQDMVIKYKPELKGFATTNHPGATGEAMDMANKLGAGLVDIAEIQTHPTVVPDKGVMVTEAVRGNGAILLNKEGKRFVNELLTRDVVSKAILDQKDGRAFLFFDKGMRNSLKATEEYFNMSLVAEADSVEALAEKLNVDKAVMTDSVKVYNELVKAGKDSQFERADLPRELNKGPYYAIEVTPAVHHTMGGLKINTDAQVLKEDGTIINGLYAAGEVTGGVHGGNRLGGNALADIITFGKIAGTNAAKLVKS
ncbi:flavocytochrome c [Paenibacillus sp. UMB4589-SE434]|uniref:flavocytochrome c n=1 Tax=Paenibacillus sp. UMB4589-SE434 TaxID=3046314 RepID=UPI00254B9926|nr:flavocytochrome c [Paenibacillus sp. UMB4589-SE434]MDK8181480.1 flavocytochrome c [Paenibacillus sp. UMB4589-SE434]